MKAQKTLTRVELKFNAGCSSDIVLIALYEMLQNLDKQSVSLEEFKLNVTDITGSDIEEDDEDD